MISVELECDYVGCTEGNLEEFLGYGSIHVADSESVDVYLNDWKNGAELRGYLPDGWEVQPRTHDGLLAVFCPKHADAKGTDHTHREWTA